MTRQKRAISTFALCSALALAASTALAERALIIVNFAYPDAAPQTALREDAFAVSEALFGLGYNVARLENPAPERIEAALQELATVTGPVVIYYAGRMQADDLLTVSGGPLALDDALTQAGDRDATMVFLDNCQTGDAASEIAAQSEDTPTLPPREGLFLVRSPDPCPEGPALTDLLLERLEIPGLDTSAMFADTDMVVQSTLTAPQVFRRADTGMRLTAEDYRMLDTLSPEAQAQMLALWAEAGIAIDRADAPTPQATVQRSAPRETVVLTQPVRPVTGGATLVPVKPAANRVRDAVSLTPRTPVPTQVSAARPVPGAGGLPQPSIIVGLIAPTNASFATATETPGPVAGSIIAFDDIAGRRALRDSDPETFGSLLQAGAFDPPPGEIVVALQTELTRMSCYTSTIDGQWGPGSRAAVGRYYEQIGGAAPSQDPDVSIFRQIVLRDDVTCPAVQAAPRPAAPAVSSQPRATQPAAPAAPAPPPAQPSRTINQSTGSGIFR